MKSKYFKLILFTFLAAIFYDDPALFLWKRLFYSFFLYLSLWEIISILYNLSIKIKTFPRNLSYFFIFYGVFIVVHLIFSLFSPKFRIITLINNPYAFLSTIPVFAFIIGYYCPKIDITKILKYICILFPIALFLPTLSKLKYYPTYVCSQALIPAFIFSLSKKYNILIYVFYFFIFCVLGYISDYRIILLRIILFSSFFICLNLFKNYAVIKIIFLLIMAVFVQQVITNLEMFLSLFETISGIPGFDATDTRSFLYEEFFYDLKSKELIYGRGFFGTYFSYYFLNLQLNNDFSDFYERFTIEVGFLELLLKGGYLYVFFYLFPLVYTALRGLFSKNYSSLTFNLCIYIIVEVFLMFFENIPFYNFEFFLLFLISGFIYRNFKYNENIRNNAII